MKRKYSNSGESDPPPSKEKKRREDHEEEEEENQKEKRERSLEEQLPEKCCREESIPSGFKDSDPQPSKVKKRREDHEEEGEDSQKEKRESNLEEQLPDKSCREESIPSGFQDSDPQPSMVKKREDHEEEEGKKQKKKKRERSVDDHLQVECCTEEKRRRQETDEGEAGPVSAEAQPSRLNPLSISSYNFYSKLGAGGYGNVVLASLGDRRPYVAVKSVRKQEAPNYSNILSESQVLNIARHSPFLCQGYAAFQTQWHAFYVMEYLSGGSLEDELKRHGTLSMDRVRFHSAEVICGLQYLHGLGIIHRDIKPMNILLDHQGHVKICDFGLAKQSLFDGDLTTGWAGTIEYMAPEILNRKTYNAAVDWWSLGITICKIATGKSPFNNSGNKNQLICSIKNHEPEIPDWLDEDLKHLLGQLLEKNRKQRLGVRGNIRCHPFYKSIDWVALEEERLQPPYQPRTPSPELFQPCKEKQSFLEYKEDEGTSGGSDTIPGFSFQSSTWLTFYTACIVHGLEALHKMGIIHRDLKLENFILDQGGYLKIIDYGLSKDRFGYTDRIYAMCGTRTYMAPEMLMDIGYGMAADWWALGISIYAMLMCELPFNNEDQNELVNSILYDEIELPEELSEDASNLIYELLEKDPDYRIGSAEAGAEVIKVHPFFRDIDWEQLLHRKTKPPYVFNNQGHLESFNNPECQAPALTRPAV